MTPTALRALPCRVAFTAALATAPSLVLADDSWEKFNDWSIADTIHPSLHMHGVGGFSDGDVEELETGGHDPKRESFSAQAIEPGISVKTQYFEAFSNYLFYQDAEGDWDGELEEAFGKIVNIPGGFEVKGGRFLSRFGALNDNHLHAWDFIDSELSLTRFLGDDGLNIEGAEISWTLPLGMDPSLVSIATLGYGNSRPHDHEHHEHDHEGEETPHEGENSTLTDDIGTARLMGRYRFNDFHTITAGASAAWGTNGFDRDTRVFGIDAEYLWRENGLETGGRAFRWRNDVLFRDVDAYSEHHEDEDNVIDEVFSGSYDEWAIYTHAIYTHNQHIEGGLRLTWVEGVDDFAQDKRFRISPSVTWWIDNSRRIGLRTQYNYDAIASEPDAHSLWFQLNIALGSDVEVR